MTKFVEKIASCAKTCAALVVSGLALLLNAAEPTITADDTSVKVSVPVGYQTGTQLILAVASSDCGPDPAAWQTTCELVASVPVEGGEYSKTFTEIGFPDGNCTVRAFFKSPYEQLDYLVVDAKNEYTDLDVLDTQIYGIECGYKPTGGGNYGQIVTARSDEGGAGTRFAIQVNGGNVTKGGYHFLSDDAATGQYVIKSVNLVYNGKNDIVVRNSEIYVNGTLKGNNFRTSPIGLRGSRMRLNALTIGSDGETGFGWWYYLKFYGQDGKLIFDSVPVRRKTDNVVGFFDRVERKFVTPSGDGSFTGGAKVADMFEYTPSVVIASRALKLSVVNNVATVTVPAGVATGEKLVLGSDEADRVLDFQSWRDVTVLSEAVPTEGGTFTCSLVGVCSFEACVLRAFTTSDDVEEGAGPQILRFTDSVAYKFSAIPVVDDTSVKVSVPAGYQTGARLVLAVAPSDCGAELSAWQTTYELAASVPAEGGEYSKTFAEIGFPDGNCTVRAFFKSYEQLEYLVVDAKDEYTDLDVLDTQIYGIECGYKPTGGGNYGQIVTARSDEGGAGTRFAIQVSGGSVTKGGYHFLSDDAVTGQYVIKGVNLVYNGKNDIVVRNSEIYVNGTLKANNFRTSPIGLRGSRMRLNALTIGSDGENGFGWWYYLKFYGQDGKLILDYVPVRRSSDNVVGFFDRVGKTFVMPSGGGSFTGGTKVVDIFEYTPDVIIASRALTLSVSDDVATVTVPAGVATGEKLVLGSDEIDRVVDLQAWHDVKVLSEAIPAEGGTFTCSLVGFCSFGVNVLRAFTTSDDVGQGTASRILRFTDLVAYECLAIPVTAAWIGGTDKDLNKASNWRCWNLRGVEMSSDMLPNRNSTAVTVSGAFAFSVPTAEDVCWRSLKFENALLADNVDWRGSFSGDLIDGFALDLAGHTLTVDDLQGNGTITDTATPGGVLCLDVPVNATASNVGILLTGSLKLLKTGAGDFLPTKTGHAYSGGTEIAGGLFKAWEVYYPNGYGITVDTGATYDVDGANQEGCHAMITGGLVLNGGTVVNQTSDITWATLPKITLTACSTLRSVCTWGMIGSGYGNTLLDLGGCTFTIEVGAGKTFDMVNCTITPGTVKSTGGGKLKFSTLAQCGSPNYNGFSLDLGTPLVLSGDVTVKDLTVNYTGTVKDGSNRLFVEGVYTPNTDYIHNFTLKNGSAINLREQTEAWPIASRTTAQALAFASGAVVTLDLAGREFGNVPTLVLDWGENKPTDVTFVLDAESRRKCYLVEKDDGIYVAKRGPTVIIVR